MLTCSSSLIPPAPLGNTFCSMDEGMSMGMDMGMDSRLGGYGHGCGYRYMVCMVMVR